jgi:hypothetical protein
VQEELLGKQMLDHILGSKKISHTSTDGLTKAHVKGKNAVEILLLENQSEAMVWYGCQYAEVISDCTRRRRSCVAQANCNVELCPWFWNTLVKGHRGTGAQLEGFN